MRARARANLYYRHFHLHRVPVVGCICICRAFEAAGVSTDTRRVDRVEFFDNPKQEIELVVARRLGHDESDDSTAWL